MKPNGLLCNTGWSQGDKESLKVPNDYLVHIHEAKEWIHQQFSMHCSPDVLRYSTMYAKYATPRVVCFAPNAMTSYC